MNAFSDIGSFLTSPFTGAYNAIKNIIGNIKGLFNFQWSLPKIKLPHFKVSGSMNSLDWFKQGVPKFSIEWYSKGGIFNNRSLIGVGDANNGFGNNPEAVVPLDQMYKNITGIVRNEMASVMSQQRPSQGNTTVVLKVNDVELAKTVIKSINDLQRSTGEILLDI